MTRATRRWNYTLFGVLLLILSTLFVAVLAVVGYVESLA